MAALTCLLPVSWDTSASRRKGPSEQVSDESGPCWIVSISSWVVNRLPINEGLRRLLARALAGPESDPSHHLEGLAGIGFFPVV